MPKSCLLPLLIIQIYICCSLCKSFERIINIINICLGFFGKNQTVSSTSIIVTWSSSSSQRMRKYRRIRLLRSSKRITKMISKLLSPIPHLFIIHSGIRSSRQTLRIKSFSLKLWLLFRPAITRNLANFMKQM